LFPASKLVIRSRDSNSELPSEQAIPVCSSPLTITAAFDLLVALCTGCVHNLKYLAGMLNDIYYSGMFSDIYLKHCHTEIKKYLQFEYLVWL